MYQALIDILDEDRKLVGDREPNAEDYRRLVARLLKLYQDANSTLRPRTNEEKENAWAAVMALRDLLFSLRISDILVDDEDLIEELSDAEDAVNLLERMLNEADEEYLRRSRSRSRKQ